VTLLVFLRRHLLDDINEVGDGHCGFRALVRFLLYLCITSGGPPDPTARAMSDPEVIRQGREYVADLIETHVDALVQATALRNRDVDPNSKRAAKNAAERVKTAENTECTLPENAKIIRNADPAKATMNRREWFGGPYRLHLAAVAMASGVPVHCCLELDSRIITVNPNGDETIVHMDQFNAGERNVFLYYASNNHFHSFVPSRFADTEEGTESA